MPVVPSDLTKVVSALEKASEISSATQKKMAAIQLAAKREAEQIKIEQGRRVVQKAVKF